MTEDLLHWIVLDSTGSKLYLFSPTVLLQYTYQAWRDKLYLCMVLCTLNLSGVLQELKAISVISYYIKWFERNVWVSGSKLDLDILIKMLANTRSSSLFHTFHVGLHFICLILSFCFPYHNCSIAASVYCVYTQHLLNICPFWRRDPSAAIPPQVSCFFSFFESKMTPCKDRSCHMLCR